MLVLSLFIFFYLLIYIHTFTQKLFFLSFCNYTFSYNLCGYWSSVYLPPAWYRPTIIYYIYKEMIMIDKNQKISFQIVDFWISFVLGTYFGILNYLPIKFILLFFLVSLIFPLLYVLKLWNYISFCDSTYFT